MSLSLPASAGGTPGPHVLIDVRDASITLEDAGYLEMVGFRVTDRRRLAAGPHAVVALRPDVIVLESSSVSNVCGAVHDIRSPRRMADAGIVVICPDDEWQQHRRAHTAGADVFLSIRPPGLEWVARAVCTALTLHGRRAAVLGFERRARLGARLCQGLATREARILLFDALDLPLLWLMLRAGYGATPVNQASLRHGLSRTPRPDLIIVDVDANPDAVRFIRTGTTRYPPILCVTSSPTTTLARLMLDPPDEGDIRIVDKNVSAQRFIEIVEGLAPDGDGSPEPDEPEAMSRRALRPHRVITEAHTSR